MKTSLAAILIGFAIIGVVTCGASKQLTHGSLSVADQNRIADAIYKVEGSRHPYGILSIKTSHPRQVCIRTISNNFTRWQKSSEDNYFVFLADRYCPPSADRVGNKRWKTNITKLLGQEFINRVNSLK